MNVVKLNRGAYAGTILCAGFSLLSYFIWGRTLPFYILGGMAVACALIALATLNAYGFAIDQEIHDRVWGKNANRL